MLLDAEIYMCYVNNMKCTEWAKNLHSKATYDY